MEYKYDVFISYSRRDYVDENGNVLPGNPITKIQETFRKHGIRYWIDEEGIYSCEPFMKVISKAIEESKMLVFISSKASNESDWTPGEILKARKEGKEILPVKIDNSEYNSLFEIALLPLDFVDYWRNPEKELGRLIRSIKAKVGKKAAEINSEVGELERSDVKMINGHEYVDLGLSVKWATCNVGATSPSDYGDYFAWGETTTKSSYTERNSITLKQSMDDIAGDSRYDAARAVWRGTWRLPTWSEMKELRSKCRWEWTLQNGSRGYRVTGCNGNSIFLPAAGWRYGEALEYVGDYGGYRCSTPYGDDPEYAYCLYFNNSYRRVARYHRYRGRSIRPVSE